MSQTRIYSVTPTAGGPVRLVEAATKAQALRHVAESLFTVEVASQRAIVEAMRAGIIVEAALGEAAPAAGADPLPTGIDSEGGSHD